MYIPNDDTGDALRRLISHGDDLTRPRDVDFTVVFPDEASAEHFADHFRLLHFRASVKFAEVADGLPWDVLVVANMEASHEKISEFEDLLQSVADRFGGRNDGWGCVTQTPTQ
jgi:hypothetical protein